MTPINHNNRLIEMGEVLVNSSRNSKEVIAFKFWDNYYSSNFNRYNRYSFDDPDWALHLFATDIGNICYKAYLVLTKKVKKLS